MTRGIGRTLGGALLTLLALATAGCGARHSVPVSAPGPAAQRPALPQDGAALFPGLPALPSGAADIEQSRSASLADNVQTGSQAFKSSTVGAFVEQTRLDMGPLAAGKYSWGMWRWGKFSGNLAPQHLAVELELTGQNKYWLLYANYGTGRWEVQGPLSAASQTYDISGTDYVSPLGNVYIAVLAVSANTLVVDTLNLIADDDVTAPAAPTGLHGINVQQHSARLAWTAPADDDIDHYELWQVEHTGDDETAINSQLINGQVPAGTTGYDLAPLAALTTYNYRVRAVDTAGNRSPLSVAGSFKTIANQPPVPSFTYAPQVVMKNTTVTFDPGATTDDDDLPGKLTLYWDWNGDGVDDAVSTGLGPITHAFHQQGLTTVKLSVWDTTDRVSTSQTINVQPFQAYQLLGNELSGEPALLLAASTDYASGRVAIALTGGGQAERLLLWQNNAWTTLAFDQLVGAKADGNVFFADVACGPGGKTGLLLYKESLIADDELTDDVQWQVYETTGTNFTLSKSGIVAPIYFYPPPSGGPDLRRYKIQSLGGGGKLAYAPNGRIAVALLHSRIPPDMFAHEDWFLTAYHELPDGSMETGDLMWQHASEQEPGQGPFTVYDYFGHWPATPYSITRSNTQTTLVCTEVRTGQIQTDTLTDASATAADAQAFTGNEAGMTGGTDPTNLSHMAWVLSTTQGTYYFGDNYGAANGGGQSFATTRVPLALFSAIPAGDNKCLFYWADLDSNDETYIRGRNSGTGALYEVSHGVGLCDPGYGGWINQGGQDGVYAVTGEQRDGQLTAYLINNANIVRQDTLVQPLAGGHVFTHSLAYATADGGMTVLAAQERPTALIAKSSSFGGSFAFSEIGADTWAYPDCAAPDSVPGEILLGSLYTVPNQASSDLILNRLAPGNTIGEHVGTVKNVKLAYMAYSAKVGQPMLVCLLGDGKTFNARLWTGSAWGVPTTVAVAPSAVNEAILRARPDGEWGLAWNEFNSTLRMTETSAGAWQPAVVLSTAILHFRPGSLDLEYATNGDAGLAVERMDAADGVYFGLKPAGAAGATWELASGTKGLDSDSMQVHWLPEWGAVVTYNVDPLISGGGLRLVTRIGTAWNTTSLPIYMRGAPLSGATSPDGTMAWAGQDVSSGEGAVSFLNW